MNNLLCRTIASVLLLLTINLAVGQMTGCKQTSVVDDHPPGPPPTQLELVTRHNARVGALTTTHSNGVIEVHWTDDDGAHFDQGDIEYSQTTDNRTALDISKFGDHLFWLGSNGEHCWLFDLRNRQKRILFRDQCGEFSNQFGVLGIAPRMLTCLLGMTPIDHIVSDPVNLSRYDANRRSWVLDAQGGGANIRMFFDCETLLPTRVEQLDGDGESVAVSDLSRYATVATPGMAVMAQPRMATRIRMQRRDNNAKTSGDVAVIYVDETVGHLDAPAHIFDIDRLISSLRPDEIRDSSSRETVGVQTRR